MNQLQDNIKYILLFDENQAFHDVMQSHFQDWGFTLLSAKTIKEGFQLFKKYAPLVILSELKTDVINGFELLERLNLYKPTSPAFYFMFITSNQEQANKNKAFLEGAMHYIAKPIVDWSNLRSRIFALTQSSLLTRQYQTLYSGVKKENEQLLTLSKIIAQKIKVNKANDSNIELIAIQEQLHEIINYFRDHYLGNPPL